jgi:hypothetical protein
MVNGQWSMVNGQWSMVNGFSGGARSVIHLNSRELFTTHHSPFTTIYPSPFSNFRNVIVLAMRNG